MAHNTNYRDMYRETMKNVLLILILLILVSCNNGNPSYEKKDTVLTGKVNHYNGENAKLYLHYSQPGSKAIRELINISEDGYFECHLSGYLPLDAMLLEKKTFANINFIYHPGDSIHIEFDTNSEGLALLKTVAFSGDRSVTNNEIIKFQILREENNLGYGAINPNELYKLNTDSFVTEMSKVKDRQLTLLNKFVSENNLTPEAKNWSTLFANETYFHFLDDYGFEKNVSKPYFDYNKSILPITMDKMICWKILAYRINRYHSTIVKPKMLQTFSNQMEAINAETINIDSLIINFIFSNSTDTLLNQISLADYYTKQFDANIISGYEANQELIKAKLDNSTIYNSLQEYYQSTFNFINKPNELTSTIIKNMDGTPINDTFAKILSDNKGKVIYLDCWATWCGPCKKAMPASKDLMFRLKEKDVSFVYVCIESEIKLWERLLSEFNLEGGQHYLMNKKQSEFFRDIMKVKEIPCYFLINKKGQLVEQGFHLHPGEKSTEEKIIKLANEL